MPFPVQFIGQKQPSPLSYLLGGVSQGLDQSREARILEEVLGSSPAQQQLEQSQAQGGIFPTQPPQQLPPGVMDEMPRNQGGFDPNAVLQKILSTPMSPQTRQQALQALQFQVELQKKQQATGGLSPQQKSKILKSIPSGASQREIINGLMERGVPQKEAVELAKSFSTPVSSQSMEKIDAQATKIQSRFNERTKLIRSKADASVNPLTGMPMIDVSGNPIPDFNNEKGKQLLKEYSQAYDNFINDVNRLYIKNGLPIPPDIERQIDEIESEINNAKIDKQEGTQQAQPRPPLNEIFGR